MEERTVSKRQLEIQLEKLKILRTPQLRLEQYPVSAGVAAELLYMAGFEHRDLQGEIIDLGTGTGRLAIGAAIMGSKRVVGVDKRECDGHRRPSRMVCIRHQKRRWKIRHCDNEPSIWDPVS